MTDADKSRTRAALIAAIAELEGKPLREQQVADLAWYRKEEQWRLLKHPIPKGQYQLLSGRQVKVLNEQAARYKLPIGEDTVNLAEAISAFHDFIAKHCDVINKSMEILSLQKQKIEEEVAKLQAETSMKQIQKKKLDNEVISREENQQKLAWLSGRLRNIGDSLGRIIGKEAQTLFNEGLEEIETEIRSDD